MNEGHLSDPRSTNIGDYAVVPAEMQAVARLLGRRALSEVSFAQVVEALPRIRGELGDRAALRAMHYFQEEQLVARRVGALRSGDVERFLALTRFSGVSSAMLLQNVSVGGASDQPSMLAIALAESLLVRNTSRVSETGVCTSGPGSRVISRTSCSYDENHLNCLA